MKTVKKNLVIVLTTFMFIMIGLGFSSCSDEVVLPVEEIDEYYVKYEFKYSTRYIGHKFSMTINTDEGSKTFTLRGPNEIIIGPVKKGFNTDMNVRLINSNDYMIQMFAQISVSKNESPFALKANSNTSSGTKSIDLSYRIR